MVSTLTILIDYDNLPARIKHKENISLIEDILKSIMSSYLIDNNIKRVTFRFYHGWRTSGRPTPLSQELTASIASSFPHVWDLRGDNIFLRTVVYAELAHSTLIAPTKILEDTYAKSEPITSTRLKNSSIQCTHPGCLISKAIDILSEGGCPKEDCDLSVSNILTEDQQKMVDVHIAVDAITLAMQDERIALVSSDLDIWPAILMSLELGANVVHIHTRRVVSRFWRTLNSMDSNYQVLTIEES